MRGSDLVLKVDPPDKERLIFIFSDNFDEPDEFVTLVKSYRDKLQGEIIKVSDNMQYKINNDDLDLLFQWDPCFGITVVVPESADLDQAFNTLKSICETI